MTDLLELSIPLLTEQLAVQEIFQWTYERDSKKLDMFHIHLDPKPGIRFNEAREICEAILAEHKGIHFALYFTKEVQKEIDLGLSRFHLICQPNNMIYQNPEQKSSITLNEQEVQMIAEQTSNYIKCEKDKILSFMEGYHFYFNNANYPHASFMLHQALELSLRTAQKLLIGDEKKSHCLVSNIDFLRKFDSCIGKLYQSKLQKEALKKLDESYSAFRYEQNFYMDLNRIEICKAMAEQALDWLFNYEKELLKEIEKKLSKEYIIHQKIKILKTKINMEKPTNINNNHRDLIHNALETYGQVHGLYCFAYVTRQDSMCNLLNVQQSHNEIHHYYLFAIMSNQNRPIMDLQNCIMQLLPEKIKVTLIQETLEQVEKKLKKGNIFRTNLLQSAECWYSDREFINKKTETQTIDLEKSKREWDRRYFNAMDLNFASAECCNDINRETQAYLSAMTMEQICLGVITLFLGYTPVTSNLNYLMNLCDVICPDITIIFHREDSIQKLQFNLLIEAQNKYRHSPHYSAKDICLENLNEQILSFFEEIDDFVKTYFDRHNVKESNNPEDIEKCA